MMYVEGGIKATKKMRRGGRSQFGRLQTPGKASGMNWRLKVKENEG